MSQIINDSNELDPVTITGRALPVKLSQSVYNVRVINSKTIEAQGAVNLKDVLAKELNIRTNNDNILGSSLNLQGISGQNIKILLDGVPIVGRENGNVDLSQINLSNIERIEIVEGPLSVVYGTDALGGVINLISKTNTSEKPFQGRVSGYTESIGVYNFGGGAGFKIKSVNISANVNRNFFDGYSPTNSRVMLWKPKLQYFGNYSMATTIGKTKIKFQSDVFNEKIENRGAPVINSVEAYAFDEYYTTNRSMNTLSVNMKVTPAHALNIITSYSTYQRDKNTFIKDLTKPNELKPIENVQSNSTNFFQGIMSRGMLSSLFKSNFNYILGYDINHNTARGTRIAKDSGFIDDYALFGGIEYKVGKMLVFRPGLRLAYNSKYKAPVVPSFQLRLNLNKRFNIKYGYARGFRAPGLKELYLNFVDYNHNIHGNSDLKAEISNNHMVSASFRHERKTHTITIDNGYFYNNIQRMISLVAVDPVTLTYRYENIDNYKTIGTNISSTLSVKSFTVTAGASYIGIYNNAFKYVGTHRYTYSPEFRLSSSYTVPKADLTFSMFYKYNGKLIGYMLDDTRQVIPTFTSDYNILDATIGKKFMDKSLGITGGVKNIFNVTTINSVGNASSVHGGGTNSMQISIGRSLFIQANYTF
ncbi:MAG: TonB-dependent receptor [Bacteroidia bacterium]|nr:TonB-dependent receptor [Bacteroidia bacterium]